MPAGPELGQGGAEVGAVEVAGKVDAEQFGRAACDVRVGAEVRVDLHREEDHAQRRHQATEEVGVAEDGIRHGREAVGDHHLLERTDQQQAQAFHQLGTPVGARCGELGQEVLGPLDGPGQQEGEEGYEGEEDG